MDNCAKIRTAAGPIGFMLLDTVPDGKVIVRMSKGPEPEGSEETMLKEALRLHRTKEGINPNFAYVECNTDTYNRIKCAFEAMTDV